MKQQIVIFGTGELAEVADFYFTYDSNYEVVGFTVDEAYLENTVFRGRPVVPFERISDAFPADKFGLFVAVGYSKLNAARAEKVAIAHGKSYKLVSYLSTRATSFRASN